MVEKQSFRRYVTLTAAKKMRGCLEVVLDRKRAKRIEAMSIMSRTLSASICFAVISFALGGAAHPEASRRLAGAIDKALASPCVTPGKTGVRVVALPSGEPVYERNGSTPLVPASVQKLITTAAALHYLGPDYRFKTEILYTGSRKNGIVNGDLVVRGKGDPKLVPEQVWLIAERIKHLNINEVTGDLVVDGTFFDSLKTAPSWSRNHTQRAYDAMLGALSVSFNTVAVHVNAGEKVGDPLIVGLFPDSAYLKLVNKARTSAKGKGGVKARRSGGKGKIVISVTGSMKPGSKEKVIYLNVPDPLKYAGEIFREYFKRGGVSIKGAIRKAAAPENARLIYTHESEPLAVILRNLNKYSNNFLAEQIVKTLAAEVGKIPGSHKNAMKLISGFLAESGIDMAGAALADASGLSRSNRVTAKLITELLTVMNRRFDIGPDFLAALGIMGVDGSVRDRMSRSPAKSKARVKTGSLAGLSSLAGYVAGKGENLFAFAIFLNDNSCYYKDADRIEDAIVTAIHKYGEAK